ncbi:hypothetical protein JW968_00205 [Candidatus Woesearchaeota archaeon]|nr:hypothetical protein [Candidatus Woesearchaeota archaeon]
MDLINGVDKKLKRGAVIIFDEIQVSMSHLEYQTLQAKVLNYVFQTFRHKNFILFMTSPHFSFINASLRKLFHARMETISIDPKKKQTTLKPMLIQVNQKTGVVYEKYLRVYTEQHGVIPLKSMKIHLPSPELLEAYEAKKDAFTRSLNESIGRDLQRMEDKESGKQHKPLTQIQERIVEYLMQNLNVSQVAEKMGNNERYIYAQMEFIKKKGLEFRPVKERQKVIYYEVIGNIP